MNDPCVLGHNDSLQAVRKNSKAIKKVWGKAQVVKFPVKCEGPPDKTSSLHKTGVLVAGSHQYMMIVTLVYKVAEVMVKQ